MKLKLTNTEGWTLKNYPMLKDIAKAEDKSIFIELETMEDLLNLMKLVDTCEVVVSNFGKTELPCIEIYDGYRE